MSSVLSKISEGLGYSAVSDSQPPPEDREKCADSDAASDKQGSSAKNDTEASTRSPSKALSDEETHSGTAPPSELSSSQCSVDPLGVGTFPSSSGNTNHQTESLDLKPLPGSWGPDDDPQLRTSSEDWLSHGRCSQYPTHRAGGPSYMGTSHITAGDTDGVNIEGFNAIRVPPSADKPRASSVQPSLREIAAEYRRLGRKYRYRTWTIKAHGISSQIPNTGLPDSLKWLGLALPHS